jgi:hypothetical protein
MPLFFLSYQSGEMAWSGLILFCLIPTINSLIIFGMEIAHPSLMVVSCHENQAMRQEMMHSKSLQYPAHA